jgi:hypothetical protein
MRRRHLRGGILGRIAGGMEKLEDPRPDLRHSSPRSLTPFAGLRRWPGNQSSAAGPRDVTGAAGVHRCNCVTKHIGLLLCQQIRLPVGQQTCLHGCQ